MATDVILLRLGSTTMESAVVLEWLSNVGDEVDEGETIVILEADKVEVELPAPASGILIAAADIGAEIDVGATVGMIGTAEEAEAMQSAGTDDTEDDVGDDVEDAGDEPDRSAPVDVEPEPSPGPAHSDTVRAAPPARKLARELGVDLATITGTGPSGRIMSEDVRAAADTASQRVRSADAVRGRIARRLAESSAQVVPVTLHRRIDATAMVGRVAHMKDAAQSEERPPSYEDMVIAAVGRALREHPTMNSSWIDDAVSPNAAIDVNVAVQAPTGLVAPLLRAADRLDVEQIAIERRRLTGRAMAGELSPDDVAPGTFTVTNLGAFGVDQFTPTVSAPQVGILGMGRLTEAMVPRDRGFDVAETMWLSLTFDHRAIDGAPAASFLGAVADILETGGNE